MLSTTIILLEEWLWDEKGIFREHGLFRIVYLADSDIGRMPRTRIRLSQRLSLGTNTSLSCFANMVGLAQLNVVCQTLYGATSAEVFAASISCICMTADFVQIWGITSVLIWSWLSLVCLEGEERPGFMLMLLIMLSGVRTHQLAG